MSEKLAALQELFPHYSADILTGVLEAENYNLEAAIDSVVRLEAEAPKPPATSLTTGFLDPDEDEEEVDPAALAAEVARMQLADELAMQEQLERIIREDSKHPDKPKGSWKQKLKNVFKRKQKQQPPQPEKLQEPLAIDEDEEEVISFAGDDKLAKGARVEDTAQGRKT